jgi:hypothetical protein
MSAAFDVVFGIFVAAIIALGVVAIRWGVRRDRVARALQTQGQTDTSPSGASPSGAGPSGASPSDAVPATPGPGPEGPAS